VTRVRTKFSKSVVPPLLGVTISARYGCTARTVTVLQTTAPGGGEGLRIFLNTRPTYENAIRPITPKHDRYELYAKYTNNRATSLSYLVTWSPEVWTAFVVTMFVIVLCMWLIVKIRSVRRVCKYI